VQAWYLAFLSLAYFAQHEDLQFCHFPANDIISFSSWPTSISQYITVPHFLHPSISCRVLIDSVTWLLWMELCRCLLYIHLHCFGYMPEIA
jgi:hypothetical protein